MPDLQAIVDFSIQINKFVNIDLFQRGFYQIRLSLKLPNCKYTNKIELNHVKNSNSAPSSPATPTFNLNGESIVGNNCNIVLPSCVFNGTPVSKTFQINYKNEEVILNDIISYRVNICLDIFNCIKQIQQTNFILDVELWYSDQEFILNQYESIYCVTTRQLKIHLDLCRGIHYYLPVIFDYFHLSAVTLSIHGCLITLCQPYICKNESPSSMWLSSFIKNDKRSTNNNTNSQHHSENGRKQMNAFIIQQWRLQLAQCKLVSIILLSLLNLKKIIGEYYRILAPWQQAKINYETLFVEISLNNLSDLSRECFREIKNNLNDDIVENTNDDLSTMIAKFQENNFQPYLVETSTYLECNKKLEDILNAIEHDIAHLSALTIEQWQRFLLLIIHSDRINQHLAKIHHFQRVKRFSEAFFCIEQPRSNLKSSCDQNSSLFLELSDHLRKSSYFINLPPCDVECVHLDGDFNSLPIIFEEKYEHSFEDNKNIGDNTINTFSDRFKNNNVSPSKLSLSSSSTSSSTSPKASIRSLFSKLSTYDKSFRNKNSSTLSPTQIQKIKDCHNTEIGFELFDLYKTELFQEKNHMDNNIDQMNRKIKLLNAFINKKNMIKNYSQLSLDYSNEKIRKSIKNLHPTYSNNMLLKGSSTPNDIVVKNSRHPESSHSWPNLSPETISHQINQDDNDTLTFHCDLDKMKKKNKKNKTKGHHHHSKMINKIEQKSSSSDYKSPQFLDVFSVVNYKSFTGTMYFPKPPKEFAMEEIDEPDEEICMKPIPVDHQTSDEVQPRKIIKKQPEILIDEIKLNKSHSLIDNSKKSHQKINNSHSFQDLTEIKVDNENNKNKLLLKNCKDDIYLKSNNLNDTKFTFMELLQSDHCLICCGSIEKRTDDSDWPCKCSNPCKSRNRQGNVPESTQPSFRRISTFNTEFISFLHDKEAFRNSVTEKVKNLLFYSDFHTLASRIPYFQCETDFKAFKDLHLIVCVHGLDGNSADLRLVKTYLEIGLPTNNFEFLMSQRNQGETFDSLETLTDRLINEIENYVSTYKLNPSKISFIGHSLGNIIIRAVISRQDFTKRWRNKMHTFLSLSGPHLGLAYNRSGLINMGLWFIQKFKKAPSLNQLSMKDAQDLKQTFLYRLSMKPGLEYFRNILLFGSSQDKYVPIHSAHIELCNAAINDSSDYGIIYREMTENILQRLMQRTEINIVRYDVHHALNSNTNTLIGRAAHIAVLDSELFIEKFMMVVGLKYFV